MTDERYTFVEDVREKKRTARGYYNKVRKGGRVKLPSDYLTAKEKKKLNGEVIGYQLNKPMGYDEFRMLPDDIQVEYINLCMYKHKGNCTWISDMLGVTKITLRRWAKKHDVKWRQIPGRASSQDRREWREFAGKFIEARNFAELEKIEEDEIENADNNIQTVINDRQRPSTDDKQSAELNNIAVLLKALAGTGAKLTIEVTL